MSEPDALSTVSPMRILGALPPEVSAQLSALVAAAAGTPVARLGSARSTNPFPKSTDLERALLPLCVAAGFLHHHDLKHPRTQERFEYDFWHPQLGVAIEVMGYRADDEIYKDIVKFHVHDDTRFGVVWVPKWKWISGVRTETNHRAALKALAFADSYMNVQALVLVTYDWEEVVDGHWMLTITS